MVERATSRASTGPRGENHADRAEHDARDRGDAGRERLRRLELRGHSHPLPRPLAEQTLDVNEFVAEHNRNAGQIQSLEAKPTIKVQGKEFSGQADGQLALERPRNFKLELLAGPMRQGRHRLERRGILVLGRR